MASSSTTPIRPRLPHESNPQTAIDLADNGGSASGTKRKRTRQEHAGSIPGNVTPTKVNAGRQPSTPLSGQQETLPHDDDEEPSAKKAKKTKRPPQERRGRRFRPQAPQNFSGIYHRATTQRFYVLRRTRTGTALCPREEVELTGSTGSIYNVTIGPFPMCTCPQGAKSQQCKHIVFVMSKVLHAPYNLVYQLALLSSELRDIFDAAPPIDEPADAPGESDKRKPIEGDCPICYSELESGGGDAGNIVWCRAACGQNMHQLCFETWARTKASGKVTCPMCRSQWEGDEKLLSQIDRTRGTMVEGYVNVADQLGVSTVRDTSTYSSWFFYHQRRREGEGYESYE